jgi:maleamate amidohydrolase
MSTRSWDSFLTERDKQVFAAAGFGKRQGFGKRPALLIVDVNYAFCGDKREPVLDSIKRWRQSGGEEAWDALPIVEALIHTAHARELPVIYTTSIRRSDNWDAGSWAWKNVRSGERPKETNLPGDEIMPQIAPSPKDIVIRKQKPSAFFGTPLMSYLTLLGCDSLIVAGTATSGCVRATVTDAFSYNLRVTLVEDGVFERSQASHAVSLFDMNAKYADIAASTEVIAFMNTLPKGMFVLPTGT